MNLWQRKLLAFLHDPPHKALDIPGHEAARDTFIRQAGFPDAGAIHETDKVADWVGAAADRTLWMSPSLRSEFGGPEHPFLHPLGGSSMAVAKPPTPEVLAEKLQAIQHYAQNLDGIPTEDRDRVNYFLHWRRWPVDAAKSDSRCLYQPADTRIPDHTIWHHNSIVSALQGCVDEAGELRPAFLLFQMGPVQEFIAQARSTRDRWSGSYLLSWMVAHAIKAVTDSVGPDAVIFPFLRAQPLFDLLHRDEIYARVPYRGRDGGQETLWDRMLPHEREMLIPNLPNRFLAVVPAGQAADLGAAAERAVNEELQRVGEAVWSWMEKRTGAKPEWKPRFDRQIAAFPQFAWQVQPWAEDVDTALSRFAAQDPASAQGLLDLRKLASARPNSGFAWPAHYAAADAALAARRNLRDFDAWPRDEHSAGALKDSLSGREEIVGDEAWWNSLRKSDDVRVRRFFRSADRLGAINLVKRVWHEAYLRDQRKLHVEKAVRFESMSDVAAGAWLDEVAGGMSDMLKTSREAFDAALAACQTIRKHAAESGLRVPDMNPDEHNVADWLSDVAPEAFMTATWTTKERKCDAVIASLNRLYAVKNTANERVLQPPPSYVAVLAFDGDLMGRWVSGEKMPAFAEQMSKEARADYGDKVKDIRRPLSPSFHLQFSEALSNFAVYLVRPVVEHFRGQLIYAGGDDVLAMVPAAAAFDCAEALRAAFQGAPRLAELVPGCFGIEGTGGGFVKLLQPKCEQPTWTMIVPGPRAEASVGIAIGHARAPLQDLVRAAQSAEKRAKSDHGRAAFAVSLFKRSGEIVEWGAKWESGALALFERFTALTKSGDLSGKFAYALEELIAPYRPPIPSSVMDPSSVFRQAVTDIADFPVWEVLDRELSRVLERQTKREVRKETATAFREAWTPYRKHLEGRKENRDPLVDLPGLLRVANFILRGERE